MIPWKRKGCVCIYICIREEKKNEKYRVYTGGGEGLDLNMRKKKNRMSEQRKEKKSTRIAPAFKQVIIS